MNFFLCILIFVISLDTLVYLINLSMIFSVEKVNSNFSDQFK